MSTDGVLELDPESGSWRLDGGIWEPSTDLYAVIGDPIEHSRSPLMHNAAFAETGTAARFMRLAVTRQQIPLLKSRGYELGLRGLSVTMPYKEIVWALCDELTPDAEAAGAVNAIRLDGRRWLGHNTDIAGIRETLACHVTPGVAGLIYGAGGSARAAVLALTQLGADPIDVVSRQGVTDRAFRTWATSTGQDVRMLTWDDVPVAITADSLLVVACVPSGVVVGDSLPRQVGQGVLLDLRYGDQQPESIDRGSWTSYDGLPVLVDQGVAAFRWWLSRPAPRNVMLAALSAS